MKTFAGVLSAILILAFFFSGCKKEQTIISGKVVNHSGCKSFKSVNNDPDTLSCVDYSFSASEHKLILKHINAGFNCCPGELSCEVTFNNDTIVIQEFEEAADCDCNCLFDLDIEITGIEAERYYLKFIEPYCGNQEKLFFEIDLKNQPDDSHCVFRDQYPWGIFKK
jgi:hypothetical protein